VTVLDRARQIVGANLDGPSEGADEAGTIRGWVAAAPAGLRVRLAQVALVAWAGASALVQVIPGPSPSPMSPLVATLFVLQWLVVTLWIPVGALVWGRRRRGLLYAAALLAYSLAYQLAGDWSPWLAGLLGGSTYPLGYVGARRAVKLAATVVAVGAALYAAPRQPD
jgi:hypothetical protein